MRLMCSTLEPKRYDFVLRERSRGIGGVSIDGNVIVSNGFLYFQGENQRGLRSEKSEMAEFEESEAVLLEWKKRRDCSLLLAIVLYET